MGTDIKELKKQLATAERMVSKLHQNPSAKSAEALNSDIDKWVNKARIIREQIHNMNHLVI